MKHTTPSSFWAQFIEGPLHPVLGTCCWDWSGLKSPGGYGRVRFKGTQWRTHRLAFFFRTNRRPPVVQHDCDRKACGRPEHLRAGTHSTNQADKIAKGRQARGEHNGRAKLTATCVAAIRAVYESKGAGAHVLARWFGVHKKTIQDIVHNRIWMPPVTRPVHQVPF